MDGWAGVAAMAWMSTWKVMNCSFWVGFWCMVWTLRHDGDGGEEGNALSVHCFMWWLIYSLHESTFSMLEWRRIVLVSAGTLRPNWWPMRGARAADVRHCEFRMHWNIAWLYLKAIPCCYAGCAASLKTPFLNTAKILVWLQQVDHMLFSTTSYWSYLDFLGQISYADLDLDVPTPLFSVLLFVE